MKETIGFFPSIDAVRANFSEATCQKHSFAFPKNEWTYQGRWAHQYEFQHHLYEIKIL